MARRAKKGAEATGLTPHGAQVGAEDAGVDDVAGETACPDGGKVSKKQEKKQGQRRSHCPPRTAEWTGPLPSSGLCRLLVLPPDRSLDISLPYCERVETALIVIVSRCHPVVKREIHDKQGKGYSQLIRRNNYILLWGSHRFSLGNDQISRLFRW